MMMKIQEKCRNLNDNIHNRMFQRNHFESTFGDYEKCFTTLDLIEDCQDAIDEFINIPENNVPKRSVLYIYGVLQATFGQQDGLYGLYQNISRKKLNNIIDFFKHFEFDKRNRDIRNDIVGHPTDRKRNTEFYFIDKGPNSKYEFSYAGYSPKFIVKKVNLKDIINEQKTLTDKVLNAVEKIINEKVKKHKEEYKNVSLYQIISSLNYSIQLINRGIWDEQRSFQAEGSLKIVRSQIDKVIVELKKRYKNSIPDTIEYTTNNILYILKKIEDWNNKGELLDNEDAKIFMIAFDKEFDELGDMLKEVDKEYAT